MANVLSTPNEPVEPTLEAIRDLIKQKSSFSDNNARTVKGKSRNTLNQSWLFVGISYPTKNPDPEDIPKIKDLESRR